MTDTDKDAEIATLRAEVERLRGHKAGERGLREGAALIVEQERARAEKAEAELERVRRNLDCEVAERARCEDAIIRERRRAERASRDASSAEAALEVETQQRNLALVRAQSAEALAARWGEMLRRAGEVLGPFAAKAWRLLPDAPAAVSLAHFSDTQVIIAELASGDLRQAAALHAEITAATEGENTQ